MELFWFLNFAFCYNNSCFGTFPPNFGLVSSTRSKSTLTSIFAKERHRNRHQDWLTHCFPPKKNGCHTFHFGASRCVPSMAASSASPLQSPSTVRFRLYSDARFRERLFTPVEKKVSFSRPFFSLLGKWSVMGHVSINSETRLEALDILGTVWVWCNIKTNKHSFMLRTSRWRGSPWFPEQKGCSISTAP